MLRFKNAFRAIFLEGNTLRFWQILNKSPLYPFLSWLRRLKSQSVIQRRKTYLGDGETRFQDKLQNLRQHGYVMVDDLLPQNLLKDIEAYVEKLIEQKNEIRKEQTIVNKDFWVRLSDHDLNQGLTSENPMVRLSLFEDILQLAGAYVGQAPYLDYVLMTLSEPNAQPLKASQLWHVDRDNDRMIKFFVYFSDVMETGDGPFTFFPKAESKAIKNSFFLSHMDDQMLQKSISLDRCKQMKGRKWTAFMCDTSVCYHMGSRVEAGHHRLMLSCLYVGLPYVSPVQPTDKFQIAGPLSPLQKATLTAQA